MTDHPRHVPQLSRSAPRLQVVHDAALFAHEERPAEIAEALLPVLAGAR